MAPRAGGGHLRPGAAIAPRTTTVVLSAVLGFPFALVLAWAFELTPQGIKGTPDEGRRAAAREHFQMHWTGHDRTASRLALGRKALEAAARLDPDGGEVHLARGILYYRGTRDFPVRRGRAHCPR